MADFLKMFKNKCETKNLSRWIFYAKKVCHTAITGYFVLYQATIRAENMHLFAYSAAIYQPVGCNM